MSKTSPNQLRRVPCPLGALAGRHHRGSPGPLTPGQVCTAAAHPLAESPECPGSWLPLHQEELEKTAPRTSRSQIPAEDLVDQGGGLGLTVQSEKKHMALKRAPLV